MEIEFKEGNRKRRLLLIVGFFLAFGTAVSVYALTSGAQPAQAQTPTRSVVVATVDIDARTVIGSSMVALKDLPDDPSLAHAYTDPLLIVGRSTGTTIYADQPVSPNMLAANAAGALFSVLAPDETIGPDTPDWRAVSLDVQDSQAVGGMVIVGQHVDIEVTTQITVGGVDSTSPQASGDPAAFDLTAVVPIAAGATPPPGVSNDCWLTPYGTVTTDTTVARYCAVSSLFQSAQSSKISLQDVEILARDGVHYVVRVNAKDGELLAHLQASGSTFALLLRGDGDSRALDPAKYGETTNRYIEDYGLPIPEAYPRPDPTFEYHTNP